MEDDCASRRAIMNWDELHSLSSDIIFADIRSRDKTDTGTIFGPAGNR